MRYRIGYIDNDRYFEGVLYLTVTAKTEFQAINQLIQDCNRNVWEIVSIEEAD